VDGIIFVNEIIASNNAVTALAPPNFPMVLDAVIKTMEFIAGKAIMAIRNS